MTMKIPGLHGREAAATPPPAIIHNHRAKNPLPGGSHFCLPNKLCSFNGNIFERGQSQDDRHEARKELPVSAEKRLRRLPHKAGDEPQND